MSDTKQRDGFVIRTFDGEEIGFIECSYNSERMRERVLGGLLMNLRDDAFIRDTRDYPDGDA